ncbi:hypothetical protein [Roseibium algae]|uniref:Uncharacterized protein n=1 Tax=Roseibium algae TaxID=3123038 RepID=A0ABU8TQ33_9HYPH
MTGISLIFPAAAAAALLCGNPKFMRRVERESGAIKQTLPPFERQGDHFASTAPDWVPDLGQPPPESLSVPQRTPSSCAKLVEVSGRIKRQFQTINDMLGYKAALGSAL